MDAPRGGVHSWLDGGDGLPGEFDAGKNWSPLNPNGIQLPGIEVERLQDGWRHLRSADRGADSLGLERGIGQQHNDISVVMSEAAVFGEFRLAAGVSDADVGGDDDVGRAWVDGWVVEV